MLTRKIVAALIAVGLSTPLWAADAQQTQDKEQVKEQTKEQAKPQVRQRARDQIYGAQMMTAEERRVYRNRMRTAKTLEEREQIRKEHHEEMVKRAKEKGVTLPVGPPMPGGGMGPGGGGMGPGK